MTERSDAPLYRPTEAQIYAFRSEWKADGPDEPEWLQKEMRLLNWLCELGLAALRSETAAPVDRNAVLEEAALRCDSFAKTGREMSADARNRLDQDSASSASLQSLAAESCASFIRALKNAAPQVNKAGAPHGDSPERFGLSGLALSNEPAESASRCVVDALKDDPLFKVFFTRDELTEADINAAKEAFIRNLDRLSERNDG